MLESRYQESLLTRDWAETLNIQGQLWQAFWWKHRAQCCCWNLWFLCQWGCWQGPCGSNREGGKICLLFLASGTLRDAEYPLINFFSTLISYRGFFYLQLRTLTGITGN